VPKFRYSAVLESGQRVTGTMESRDRRDALRQLLDRGYHPLAVDAPESGGSRVRRVIRRVFLRIGASDLAVFARQLAALLKAGLPLSTALSTLVSQCESRHLVSVIQDIEQQLSREAGSLADCLEAHPDVFDSVFRGLVRAGETGGNLTDVLDNLAGHLSQSSKLRGRVLGAFIYPAVLVLLGVSAVFVLMTFVIPRFQEMFASFEQSLPWLTEVLIKVSDFMANWWWGVLGALLLSVLLCVAALNRPPIKLKVDRLLLKCPVLGRMFLKVEISRISRTLGALMCNGVPILEALRITGETAKNLAVRFTFHSMIKGVSEGSSLASVAKNAGVYPPLMLNLIRTGEETGELPQMLEELSAIYEDEADRAVTNAVKLVEPVLIVVMGSIIAAIVAAVMLPVFQANIMVE